MDFAILADHRVKMKPSEKIDKYLDLAWELKKLWNMKGDSDINCHLCLWNFPQSLEKKPKGIETKEMFQI